MPSEGIDVNRGVMIQKHPSMGLVYMYVDTPGEFLNAFGKPVPDAVAKQAHYDVETLGKERLKRERMREAMTAIELELELANTAEEENVLWERGGYRVVGLALGNAIVFDDENNKLTPIAIPKEAAKLLLDHLVPEEHAKVTYEEDEDHGGTKT